MFFNFLFDGFVAKVSSGVDVKVRIGLRVHALCLFLAFLLYFFSLCFEFV